MISVQNTTENTDGELLRKGEKVAVRLFDGSIVERLVWEDHIDHVFICTEKTFQQLLSGADCPAPIGFPSEDVIKRS